ncbi:TolC family protein [Laspinema olomoucense]|uniref:TolC family protein n=1 Tax=Laspinema olomoucense D3b TaxID=2953688 RepID=A0ABT2N9P5_9CYAN|nr:MULTISPECIES: TolC family protein [unclassified Laspinema]MCT7972967.1 TolC family protein [Laspinema sp. D3d]MCT7977991.1 TolC family protein [Laspinema sp. D3b]
MQNNPDTKHGEMAIATQMKKQRPVWMTVTVSFMAAIFGTSLTLLAGSKFHEGGIAEEVTPKAILEQITVSELPVTPVTSSELPSPPQGNVPSVVGDLLSRLTPDFPTPSPVSAVKPAGSLGNVRKDGPPIDVPPPAEPLDQIVMPGREPEVPQGDRREQNEVISQSLPQLPVEANPPSGDRDLNPATVPLFENRPAELQQVPVTVPETRPGVQETPGDRSFEGIPVTLVEVVGLAIQNNREIKNAYLQRIADRASLAVELDKFQPIFTPEISVNLNRNDVGSASSNSADISAGSRVTMRIPTGGEINAAWNTGGITRSSNQGEILDKNNVNQGLSLSFSQPLLRGFGRDINTAPIKIAQLMESINKLSLNSTLIDIITNAVVGYRDLLQAEEAVKIAENSLKIAQDIFEINRALVEAGRQPRNELVQNERNIANLRIQLLSAQNTFEQVRLNLLNILDIDDFPLIPGEEIVVESTELNEEKLKQLALQNSAIYLNAELAVEIGELNLILAEDEMRWDMSLTASYGSNLQSRTDDTNDVRLGIGLSRNFGDRRVESRLEQQRVNLLQAQNDRDEQRDNLLIQVGDQVRNANLLLQQVNLALQEREFAEQNLENERELLRLGRGEIRNVIGAQQEVVSANNSELTAQINYLNALTLLEKTVGITLETWQVTVETPEE